MRAMSRLSLMNINNLFNKIIHKIFFILILILSSISACLSEQLVIISDKLEVNRNTMTSIFTGNVYAKEKELEIWTDRLEVKFIKNNNKNEVKEIVAESSVKIINERGIAHSDYGLYYPGKDLIKLSGNVNVNENGNIIKCDKLALDLKNSTSIMTSNSSQRVEAKIINESLN